MTLQTTFIGIAVLALVLLYIGTGKNLKVIVVGSLWLVIIGLLSFIGFFQNTAILPPRMLWIFLPMIILTVLCYRNLNIKNIKLNYLIAIHVLRIPVEFSLYQLFLNGNIPVNMTFRGWNFDILMGISAMIYLAYYTLVNKQLNVEIFRVWNIMGLLFLFVIVSIAILAAPSPIQLISFDSPNVAMMKFPYTLLPALIVPIVLLSHLLCLKKLKL